jgi:hypothetical protein
MGWTDKNLVSLMSAGLMRWVGFGGEGCLGSVGSGG